MDIKGKVAVVTGATGGLGKIICKKLAENGANVVIGYNSSRAEAEKLIKQLHSVHLGHLVAEAPVTQSQKLYKLAEKVEQIFGRCDILINCAGITRFVEHSHLDELDDDLIDSILATNIRGPIAMTRAFQNLLNKSEEAIILNISSIAAKTAMGSNIAYCASKAALDNLTISLARALAPKIRVISVAPGLTDTDFVKALDQDWKNIQQQSTPLGRLAYPEEIAQAVIVAITHLTFTTGTVIPVDGGRPIN
ncbi:SDR family oxidoreductase [Acinetobacter baumannii]|uniref:SDR family NAD(P)-dependent oxidoreductase n=1 Tax=Acinetobacter baumannii TaxID=470 RepID=UPI0018FF489F|nr:SDR family oxidoreductase [Acinetobacter baumannii]MBJ9417869.1 SDR family oxidoreductase [Acinetobacter baumannii]MDV7597738.1 SDR family oxidoreductase [Acinetobacter baumannii]MDV7663851.1 SDR family oxidoreductase [Acinetobacter baumannii]